jgi:outer membrane protein OmpA-like peptidoglycan-associated protein
VNTENAGRLINKKYSILAFFILVLIYSSLEFAQERKKIFQPLNGSVLLSLEGSATFTQTDYNTPNIDFAWRGLGEYYFNLYSRYFLGARLAGGTGYIAGKQLSYISQGISRSFQTSIYYAGVGVEFGYQVTSQVFPFISLGLNTLFFDPRYYSGGRLPNNAQNVYSRRTTSEYIELGCRYFVTDKIAVNLSLDQYIVPTDYLDDLKRGSSNDTYSQLNIGVSYVLFGKKDSDGDGVPDDADECPNTPSGVKVDSHGCPLDADGDGVPDYLDKCSNTPKGVKVDASGCPLDSDHDGVPDYLDKCPNTPKGVKIDAFGCPLDSDGDGVPDYLDKCPNTPSGVKVDASGCPLDSDHDGVPDYEDKCPNTPKGVRVDAFGCPLDSDGDGVPDYLDKCPNTPRGTNVNASGCPIIHDSDGDGVPDNIDKCPNTPAGVKVDSLGCPLDSDHDGVPDFKDRCKHTPRGVKVDRHGCPLDSDHDGVPDYKDKCPNTPRGVKVDKFGCPIPADKYILKSEKYFGTGSATLLPSATSNLNDIVLKMKEDPTSRWRIEGYTDYENPSSFNQTLAFNRANAVYLFFVRNGLNKNRFDIVGTGGYYHQKSNSKIIAKSNNVGVVITKIK